MTAALAIAATSEVLRFVIAQALVETGSALGVDSPTVSVGPPSQRTIASAVNVFLCQVARHPSSSRNTAGFVRTPVGEREYPPLQLDLTYLVSAHGEGGEIGLGAAIEALGRAPVLSPATIRAALSALSDEDDPLRRILAGAGVIDGFESLTIAPQLPSLAGAAGFWIATQAPFAPSAFYVASLVFHADASPAAGSIIAGPA